MTTCNNRPCKSLARGVVLFGGMIATLMLCLSAPTMGGQTYFFSQVVNENQARPDGMGNFGSTAASIDGTTVVFRSPEGGPPNSIWTSGIFGENLQKIVDTTTATPGFPGAHFTSFWLDNEDPQGLFAKNGIIIFHGFSVDASNNTRFGLYSVPESGGPVTLLVDYATPIPDGAGNFTTIDANYSVDGGRVVFNGSGPGNIGVFSVKVDGTGLVPVADQSHMTHLDFTSPVGSFFGTGVGSGQVAFLGGNGFDFSQGINTLTVAPVTGGFAYNEVFFSGYLNSGETLPDDTNPNYHTRLDGALIDGSNAVFSADDSGNGGTTFGFYSVPLAGGTPQKLVDETDVLPGGGMLERFAFGGNYVSEGGQLIFLANNGTPALYSQQNGVITRLFGAGDTILGYVPNYQTGISPGSYSAGRILLITGQRFNQSLSVATPVPAFFAGEAALSNTAYYLAFPNGNIFGYYNYQFYPTLYHYDLGFEYVIDANDGVGGVYLYDFATGHFLYTGSAFSFPYLYDFGLSAFLYYLPDTTNPGHYTTNPRYFANLTTGQIITQ